MAGKFEFSIRSLFENAGINSAVSGLKNLKSRIVSVVTASSSMAKSWGNGLAKITSMASGLVSGFNKVKSAAMSVVKHVFALTAALAGTIREAVKFNIKMAWASTIYKGSGFLELRKQVKDLSAELGVAKSQLADGLYQSLSAGVPEDNVFAFLKTAAKTAVADGSDVATSVDGITTVLNAFKIKSEDSEKVADKMFKTVANGKTTFSELAQNLATVAPLASSTGIAFDEVLAAIASLTKQGTPTAQAVTQIRAAIIATSEVMGDGWSKTMSLQDAFAAVAKQAGGSQNKLRDLVGRVEAMNGILGLTGENATIAKDDLDAMANSAGSLDTAFKKMDQVRNWDKLWQTVHSYILDIGERFNTVMAPAVETITAKIKSWREDNGFLDVLEQKLAMVRELVMGIWQAFEEGKGREVISATGELLVGYIQLGFEKGVQAVLKAIPIIFDAAWQAFKGTFKGEWTKAFSKDLNMQANKRAKVSNPNWDDMSWKEQRSAFSEQKAAIVQERMQEKGSDFSAMFQGGGKDKVDSATEKLKSLAGLEEAAVDAAEVITLVWNEQQETLKEFRQREQEAYDKLSQGINVTSDKIVESTDTGVSAMNESADSYVNMAEEKTGKIEDTTQKSVTAIDEAGALVEKAANNAGTMIGGAITNLGSSVEGIGRSTKTNLDKVNSNLDSMSIAIARGFDAIHGRLNAIESTAKRAAYDAQVNSEQIKNMRS